MDKGKKPWYVAVLVWAGIAAAAWYISTQPLPDQVELLWIIGGIAIWFLWRVFADVCAEADRKLLIVNQRLDHAAAEASKLRERVWELEDRLRPYTPRDEEFLSEIHQTLTSADWPAE